MSTPLPMASADEERALQGLFPKSAIPQVAANLLQDLKDQGLNAETLLASYQKEIGDPDRLVRATKDIEGLFKGDRSEATLQRLVEVLYFSGYQRLLAKHRVLFPAYNVLEEYFVNATGPWGPVILPRPVVPDRSWSLFGQSIGFPIGIPASFLTDNSRWVQYFATNGFNVLTFRTVRSRATTPNEPPNWAFASSQRTPLPLENYQEVTVRSDPTDWVDPGARYVSTTNSFGVPSSDPLEWKADLKNAMSVLADDQILIVSVMGDDYDGTGDPAVLIEDYVRVALEAQSAGARFIELNLSCPNSLAMGGDVKDPICQNVELAASIVEAVRLALKPDIRLIAKLSFLDGPTLLSLMERIASHIDAAAAINTLQVAVLRDDDEPTFPGRRRAGVSGIAIRDHAKDMIRRLAELRLVIGEPYEIIGMGGVTDPRSFLELYEAGASVVQVATGAFANPFLAAECVSELGGSLPLSPSLDTSGLEPVVRQILLEMADSTKSFDKYAVAAHLPLKPSQTISLIAELEAEGELRLLGGAGSNRYGRAQGKGYRK